MPRPGEDLLLVEDRPWMLAYAGISPFTLWQNILEVERELGQSQLEYPR